MPAKDAQSTAIATQTTLARDHNVSLSTLVELVRGRDAKRRFDPIWTDHTIMYSRSIRKLLQGV